MHYGRSKVLEPNDLNERKSNQQVLSQKRNTIKSNLPSSHDKILQNLKKPVANVIASSKILKTSPFNQKGDKEASTITSSIQYFRKIISKAINKKV